jgi:hypothetical protein
MALTMRQFKFLCFAACESRVGENKALKYSIVYPICVVTRAARHTRYRRDTFPCEYDPARTSLILFDHDRFTDFVISGDAS